MTHSMQHIIPDAMKFTKAYILERQALQIAHYVEMYGERAREVIEAATHPELVPDDQRLPVWEIHRHIPCGHKIEMLLIEAGMIKERAA